LLEVAVKNTVCNEQKLHYKVASSYACTFENVVFNTTKAVEQKLQNLL